MKCSRKLSPLKAAVKSNHRAHSRPAVSHTCSAAQFSVKPRCALGNKTCTPSLGPVHKPSRAGNGLRCPGDGASGQSPSRLERRWSRGKVRETEEGPSKQCHIVAKDCCRLAVRWRSFAPPWALTWFQLDLIWLLCLLAQPFCELTSITLQLKVLWNWQAFSFLC